mgnify:CR=1 FL=1
MSWFVCIKRLLIKYDLPSAYDLFEDPPKKSEWKAIVTSAINNYWDEQGRSDAASKCSLKYLNTSIFCTGSVHPVWATLSGSCREVEMAAVKARLLTGTYVLQANRAKFNQFDVDPTCTICNDGPEDRCHFIVGCSRLENTRRYHIGRIFSLLQRVYSSKIAETLIRNKNSLLQIILDCTHQSLSNMEIQPPLATMCEDIEPMSRLMCYSLHMKRASMLKMFVG